MHAYIFSLFNLDIKEYDFWNGGVQLMVVTNPFLSLGFKNPDSEKRALKLKPKLYLKLSFKGNIFFSTIHIYILYGYMYIGLIHIYI